MRRRVAHVFLAVLVAAGCAACGGSAPQGPHAPVDVEVGAPVPPARAPAPPPAPPPPPKRDALDLAVAMVRARAAALVHVESWRDHPSLPRMLGRLPFRGALERSGIDLARDVDRLLLAGPDPRVWSGIAIYEHHIDRPRLEKFLVEAAQESQPAGAPLRQGDMIGVRISQRVPGRHPGEHRTLVGDVWLVTPTLIVVVPPRTTGVEQFARSAGLPLPTKGEGASGWAVEPSAAFSNPHVRIPDSLVRAEVWAFPASGGGVRAEVRARSVDPEIAKADAASLTRSLDRATSVKLGPLTVRVFQPPVFRAEGDEVIAETQLTRAQLDQLLVFAQGSMPSF